MPTQQPSSAPDDAPRPHDADTPARVLSDPAGDAIPGGGGLGGAAAADPLGGSGRTPTGTAPNAPIDVPVPHSGSDAAGEAEARVRASVTDVSETQSGER